MSTKIVDVAGKSVSCRQNQDDPAQKNIFCSKQLLFFSRTAGHTLKMNANIMKTKQTEGENESKNERNIRPVSENQWNK